MLESKGTSKYCGEKTEEEQRLGHGVLFKIKNREKILWQSQKIFHFLLQKDKNQKITGLELHTELFYIVLSLL